MLDIKTFCNTIKKTIEAKARGAAAQIPAIVMLCSLAKRPGLSSLVSAINWIQGLKKYGIPTEPLPSGAPNNWVIAGALGLEEIYRALREDANFQGAIAPGAINFVGTGPSTPGNITVTGSNIGPVKMNHGQVL